MQRGTGSITLVDESHAVSAVINVNSSAVVVSDNVANITVPSLTAGSLYHVEVPATAFVSFSGLYYQGSAVPVCSSGQRCSPQSWAFVTRGAVVPSVALWPAHLVQGALVGATNLSLRFSEYVVRGSGSVIVSNMKSGVSVAVNESSLVFVGATVYVKVPALALGANYTVVVPYGALVSAAGVDWPGTTADQWTFVTAGACAAERAWRRM